MRVQVADLVLCGRYGDLEMDEYPVLVLQCGHVFTVETLDGHMGVRDVYQVNDQGVPPSRCCALGLP